MIDAPVFPRYIFFKADGHPGPMLRSTPGVSRLVCNGTEPAVVSDATINDLKRNEAAGVFNKYFDNLGLRPGKRVQITDGLFSDFVGKIERMDEHERVTVLVEIFSRKEVRVEIDAGLVAAA